MPERFRTERRIEFRDTDAAGIMHFSTYFTYMEEVEHEFLRSLGWSVVQETPAGVISWPRVSANCDYQKPSRFEDLLQIELTVRRLGTKSATYEFRFFNDETPLAHGAITAVCCRVQRGVPPQSIPIPNELRQQLERFQVD